MSGAVYRNISCLITNSGVREKNGIRPEEKDLGLLKKAALVFSSTKGVLWLGEDKKLPKTYRGRAWREYDCRGLTAYPGLVDPHTHLAFAGDRSHEFSLRMGGASYQEIAAAGGGILYSTKATRAASLTELTKLAVKRLDVAYNFGVRLLEAKSGYGLTEKDEIKSLQAIAEAAKQYKKIKLSATCLAAHAVPVEFKGNSAEYVKLVCEKILPLAKKQKLAKAVDVFCDPGFFSLEEARTILHAAKNLGFLVKLHGEELANTGAAELAAEMGALSVDHLLKISDKGISALAKSQTVGVLLPGTSFYLREPAAPARKLIDAGVAIALASDFNPGTCPTQNLPFVGTLAALQLKMTTAEIIAALTWNGARALAESGTYGALLPGYRGEPVFVEGDHPSALFYRMAPGSLVFPKRS